MRPGAAITVIRKSAIQPTTVHIRKAFVSGVSTRRCQVTHAVDRSQLSSTTESSGHAAARRGNGVATAIRAQNGLATIAVATAVCVFVDMVRGRRGALITVTGLAAFQNAGVGGTHGGKQCRQAEHGCKELFHSSDLTVDEGSLHRNKFPGAIDTNDPTQPPETCTWQIGEASTCASFIHAIHGRRPW